MPPLISIATGTRFGRYVVRRQADNLGRQPAWECLCDCGNGKVVSGIALRHGRTNSCGCLRIEVSTKKGTTHGGRHTASYIVWSGMIDRCRRKKNKHWKDYGGRGIKVCQRWMKFENFFADMGERPDGLTIDRKDNDGDYEPANCRWATHHQQRMNQRRVPPHRRGL